MTRADLIKAQHKRSEEQRELEQKQLRETLKVASSIENEVGQIPPREMARPTAKKGYCLKSC